MKQTETPKTRPQQLGPSRPDPSRRRPAEATAALVTGIRRPGSPARGAQFTPLTLTRSVSSFSDVGGWRLEPLAPRSFGLNPCFEHVCSLSPSGRCTETDRRRPRSPTRVRPVVGADRPAGSQSAVRTCHARCHGHRLPRRPHRPLGSARRRVRPLLEASRGGRGRRAGLLATVGGQAPPLSQRPPLLTPRGLLSISRCINT